jgi:uncharacterized protein (DUF1697 family)
MNYIAFLRGINLGPTHKVPMKDLQTCFFDLGFTNVKTLLNSGNIFFATDETNIASLKKGIQEAQKKMFGWDIETIVRSQKDIQDMVEENPFRSITVTPQTRLYVTFLPGKPTSTLAIPYISLEDNYTILEVSHDAVFSVLSLSKKFGTIDAMDILGKEFGKNITTRNWNTIVKLANLQK